MWRLYDVGNEETGRYGAWWLKSFGVEYSNTASRISGSVRLTVRSW